MLDCDEPHIACFFGTTDLIFEEASADFNTNVGALSRGIDRYEDEICEGENPRTTMVVLHSDVADVPSMEVETDDSSGDEGAGDAFSTPRSGADIIGDAVLLSCDGVVILFQSGTRYEWVLIVNGSRSFFSSMVMTINSRSSAVICLSLPQFRLQPESCLLTRGLVVVTGAGVDSTSSLSDSMAFSSANESRLPDRSGTSAV